MSKKLFMAGAVAAVLLAAFLYDNRETGYEFPDGYELAVWEWRSPRDFDETGRQVLLDELKEQKINMIYLNIEDYINILETSSDRRDEELASFFFSLDSFLEDAEARGISVEALAGAREWARVSHDYIPRALLEFTILYNESRERKLSGIQFDIEYYNIPSFRTNAERETLLFLNLARDLSEYAEENSPGLRLGFAVPYWFVNETPGSPETRYRGEAKMPGEHLLDTLSEHGNSYVAIMSYRDRPDGRGGTIDIIRNILAYIEESGYEVKAVAGQETTDVEPARITHYGRSRQHLKFSVSEVLHEYSGNASLVGAAIHHSESFLEMEERIEDS